MSEPIPSVPDVPDALAARALAVLVELVHTDPVLNVFALARPMYWVFDGKIEISFMLGGRSGPELLAAAQAFFGGEVNITSHRRDEEKHTLTTTWQHVPLNIEIVVPCEDELIALRKRLAELESAGAYRLAQMDEQRHQVEDPAVPDPAAYIAVTV